MKITLTKLTSHDVREVHSLWSDEQATRFTNFPFLPTVHECSERLAKMIAHYGQRDDHFGPYAIRGDGGEFYGLAGGDAGESPGEFEIWYFIRRDMWGKQVATVAVTRMIQEMKESGRVTRIRAEAVVDNEPSWRFLAKLGFSRVRLLPDAHKKDEKTWDRFLYSMTVSR